jgi:hypothetical protein
MAVVTSFAYPNYSGALYTKSNTQTPFLNLIGEGKSTNSVKFAVNQEYSLGEAAQPEISENASLTAPEAEGVARAQKYNVTQIFHETIAVSYAKESNMGTLSGINVAGQQPNPTDELAFQKAMAMQKIMNDMEYTFINGKYQEAATDAQANKTRGILGAITTNAVQESGAVNSSTIRNVLNNFFKTMYDNTKQYLDGNTIMVNSTIKAAISEAFAGTHMVVSNGFKLAGINIMDLMTDFGTMHIVLAPTIPTNTLLCFKPEVCHIVEQFTPGKGNFFYEELAKTGAADKGQIFGQAGLDYGAEFLHGKLEFGA